MMILFYILLLNLAYCFGGVVIDLNQTSFISEVLSPDPYTSPNALSHWIIQFYAPWCHHCQKFKPVLEKIADYAAAKVVIAKMDATAESEVAAALNVTKYPTILYKLGTSKRFSSLENIPEDLFGVYDGARSFTGLTAFIDRIDSTPCLNINKIEDLHTAETADSNVTFVLQPAKNTGVEAISEFQELAKRLYLHTSFAILNDRSKLPSLCKYESLPAHATVTLRYCMDLSKQATLSAENIENFILGNNYPLISTFEGHNFKTLAHLNKTMVLAVVDHRSHRSAVMNDILTAFETLALNTLKTHPDIYIFGHIDARKWHGFVKMHESIAPSLLLIDHEDERHANFKLLEAKQTVDSYLQTMEKIMNDLIDGKVDMRESLPLPLWRKIFHRFERYGYFGLLLVILPIALGLLSFAFPHPKSKKGNKQL